MESANASLLALNAHVHSWLTHRACSCVAPTMRMSASLNQRIQGVITLSHEGVRFNLLSGSNFVANGCRASFTAHITCQGSIFAAHIQPTGVAAATRGIKDTVQLV